MPNSYFSFKQFTVQQDKSAMKVCTDACLFGAWVANTVVNSDWQIGHMLDIGTGTGLLSLMLAQQINAKIDAIEIDEAAAAQAAENFKASPWKERLMASKNDARLFQCSRKYDLIISNPPFFGNDLKSADAKRNLALHSDQLSLHELLNIIQKHLSATGKFAVLLPYHRKPGFEQLAIDAGFFLINEMLVKQTSQHSFFRAMLIFSTIKNSCCSNEMSIKTEDIYSGDFNHFLRDYYLNQ